jgi:hypothetical protein
MLYKECVCCTKNVYAVQKMCMMYEKWGMCMLYEKWKMCMLYEEWRMILYEGCLWSVYAMMKGGAIWNAETARVEMGMQQTVETTTVERCVWGTLLKAKNGLQHTSSFNALRGYKLTNCQMCPYQTCPFQHYYQPSSEADFKSSLQPPNPHFILFLFFWWRSFTVPGTKVAPFL